MKKLIFILTILLAFTACKTKQAVSTPQTIIKDSIRVVEKLIPVQLPADSSAIYALFECDSANNVILKQLNEEKSKHVATKINFIPGKTAKLDYKSKTTPDTVYIKGTDRLIYKDRPVITEKPVYINKLNLFQKILMWSGVAFWILVGLAIYKLFKK